MKQDYKLAVARYLEGDMEMQEMIAFEKEIKESKDLQQAIENYKSSKNQVQDPPNVNRIVSAKPKAASKLPIIVSVVVALLIAAGLFIWAPWSSGLYEKYAISRVMPLPQKSADAQGNISKGAALFNEGKFDKSRKLLQAEYMLNPQNPVLSYYFAITLVETRKEYEARTIFMNLYKGETAFKYDAMYYVALSFLKEGNEAAAKEWLQKTPAQSANAAKAKALIVELEK
jgi:tetratricopeptide (TPR) repeat protein